MTFSLGSIDFNDDIADGDGVRWYVDVDGWDTLSNRVSDVSFPSKHGGRVTQNLYEPRQLTLKGTAAASDVEGYWAARNTLTSVTNVLTSFTDLPLLLTVPEEVDKQMAVLRTSLLMRCIDDIVMQFELTLRADDPFKYATTVSTLTTSGSAVNGGTAPTYPTFELTSTGTPTLTAGTQSWSASASIPSGTVIDMGTMTAVNGVTSHLAKVNLASDWIFLPPGTTAVASTVAGTWSWREAWL